MKKSKSLTLGIMTTVLLLSACNDKKPKTKEPIYEAPYTIGAQRMVFHDDKIYSKISAKVSELLGATEGKKRELMVKIWYPALPTQNEGSRHDYGFHTNEHLYPVDPTGDSYSELINLYQSFSKQSETYYDANPIEKQSFQVIIDSPGYGTNIENYQTYYESLVKQGYIVVAIAHSQETPYVTVNEGIGIGINEALVVDLDRHLPQSEWDFSQILTDEETQTLVSLSLGKEVAVESLKKHHYLSDLQTGKQEHLNLWVEDTKFVLSELTRINNGEIDSNLKGMFDLTSIGASGHSFGGASARRFCNQEVSCQASINMDGSSFASFGEKIVNPHLNFNSDFEASIYEMIRDGVVFEDEEEALEALQSISNDFIIESHAIINAAQSDLLVFRLKTISHNDFQFGWADLHDYGLGKQILNPIIEASSLAFFNLHLKPEHKITAKQKLCSLISEHDALVSEYNNVCL
jgi:hypothetical protein